MNDLNERIREFIDAGATRVSADEIIVMYSTMESTPKTGRPPIRRRRRLIVLSGASAIAVSIALIIASLITVPGVKSTGVAPASAATFLKSVAATAASQEALVPGPGQYLYVATIESNLNGAGQHPSPKMYWFDSNELHQVWTSPRAPGHQTYATVGRPEFVSAADRAIWVIDGSPPLGSGNSGGPTPPYYNVAGLPTKMSGLVEYFRSQAILPSEAWYGSRPSWEFGTALSFLQSGASSAQRAALLRFIATIPGVQLKGHATSIVTGQKGSVIALPVGRSGLSEEAIFDAKTSNLMEVRYVFTSLPRKSEVPGPAPKPFVGEIQSYTDLMFAGITHANSKYSLPTGTPTFPHIWPFGSVRVPLPGWLGDSSAG